eukprot:GHVT01049909.1.p1 GENE.GHVT01049909.1~~GHVT01049909.1.p1  ORF type:complete len:200 (+),score=50.81 GHVT01049909.1:357-956(+)
MQSVAFKNSVGSRRSSWRIAGSQIQKSKTKKHPEKLRIANLYRAEIETELQKHCNEILEILDDLLHRGKPSAGSRTFYNKMRGDYFRYLSEFSPEGNRRASAEKAREAYQAATDLAVTELQPLHPIRLGLALNFAVFHYEILNNPTAAIQMAQSSFDAAVADMEGAQEETYKEATLLLQLLRDNLSLWTADVVAPRGGH